MATEDIEISTSDQHVPNALEKIGAVPYVRKGYVYWKLPDGSEWTLHSTARALAICLRCAYR